jgi:hypothetical protein
MHAFTPRTRLATVSALTALGAFASLGTATAAEPALNGEWAPFTRCPVDAPAMLAADGFEKTPQCVVSTSSGGSIKLGDTTVVTGRTNLQIGIVQNADGTSTVVAPPGGALVAEPATVPGGLLGLMCPSAIPVITGLCESLENSSLNKITATMESVGAPYDFNQTAGVLTDMPIVALPVRIHLENPLLGSKCYIGTAANPIVLLPENRNDPAGEMSRIDLTGAVQNDSTFAVPAASGCGLNIGLINAAVNAKTGLPSPSGNNSLTLNDTQTRLTGLNAPGTAVPRAGQVLAEHWHSAVR